MQSPQLILTCPTFAEYFKTIFTQTVILVIGSYYRPFLRKESAQKSLYVKPHPAGLGSSGQTSEWKNKAAHLCALVQDWRVKVSAHCFICIESQQLDSIQANTSQGAAKTCSHHNYRQ